MSMEDKAQLVDKLSRFYYSDYVKHNRPDIWKAPFQDWLSRQLIRIGVEL